MTDDLPAQVDAAGTNQHQQPTLPVPIAQTPRPQALPDPKQIPRGARKKCPKCQGKIFRAYDKGPYVEICCNDPKCAVTVMISNLPRQPLQRIPFPAPQAHEVPQDESHSDSETRTN